MFLTIREKSCLTLRQLWVALLIVDMHYALTFKNKQSSCYQSTQLLQSRGYKETIFFLMNAKTNSVLKLSLSIWICILPLCRCFCMFIRQWNLEILSVGHLPFLIRNKGSWDVRGRGEEGGLKVFSIWERGGGNSWLKTVPLCS